jgi:hypothetical protein
MNARPTAAERLANPDAFLSRGDLRELGLERRAVDAVFRACPIVAFPGYSRPMIRVRDYLALVEEFTQRRAHERPLVTRKTDPSRPQCHRAGCSIPSTMRGAGPHVVR